MAVKILTAAQKQAVVTIYTSNNKPKSIQELAALLNVSTSTISRVLEEAGVITSKKLHGTDDMAKVMSILYKHKINPDMLEDILAEPAMIPSNVSVFLNECNQEQLYVILLGAGLINHTNPQVRNMVANAVVNATPGNPIPKSAQLSLIPPVKRQST